MRKKNVIKTKTKKLFSVENNSKSFEEKKNPHQKNANCVVRTCAGVLQRTRKRMSYGGGVYCRIFNNKKSASKKVSKNKLPTKIKTGVMANKTREILHET